MTPGFKDFFARARYFPDFVPVVDDVIGAVRIRSEPRPRGRIVRDLVVCFNSNYMDTFDAMMARGGEAAIRTAGRFFMRDDPVHQTLRAIAQRLTELQIPYCIAGGMALVAHGYDRTTADVDVIVTEEGLAAIHQNLDGRGYLPPFKNSKNLRDTTTQVRIEFLVTGRFPGDGKPKPVAFPDPAKEGIEINGIRYIGLPSLLELKVASGISAPHRLKDLADAQELIRVLRLPREFMDRLNPYVRDKFDELWTALQQSPPEE